MFGLEQADVQWQRGGKKQLLMKLAAQLILFPSKTTSDQTV